jgi:hypothetical protein
LVTHVEQQRVTSEIAGSQLVAFDAQGMGVGARGRLAIDFVDHASIRIRRGDD